MKPLHLHSALIRAAKHKIGLRELALFVAIPTYSTIPGIASLTGWDASVIKARASVLVKKGFVESDRHGMYSIYSLTEKGKAAFAEILNQKIS